MVLPLKKKKEAEYILICRSLRRKRSEARSREADEEWGPRKKVLDWKIQTVLEPEQGGSSYNHKL